MHVYFSAIGGAGIGPLAELAVQAGYEVSGSDKQMSSYITALKKSGIKDIYIDQSEENIARVHASHPIDWLVYSSALLFESTPSEEIQFAKDNNIKLSKRDELINQIAKDKNLSMIAIAGTHGKTTTTSLCAEVLAQCGLDPTFIIGGKLAVTGSNAKLGAGEYLVAEADESDASFLYLNPLISVVTNIDLDHMDAYEHDENKLKQTFIDFLHRLPFYGRAILCNEDKRVREIIPEIKRPIVTYGLSDDCDVYANDIVSDGNKMHFTVHIKNAKTHKHSITLNIPGVHNVLNALAVIAVATECEGKVSDIANGLADFHGVGRRCQQYPNVVNDGKSAILIDDYGHHPAELRATLAALKAAYPDKRMVLIFQPHRYTRTRDLFDDFVNVLSNVEVLILLEVYSAGEEPIALADGRSLLRAVRLQGNVNTIFAKDLIDAKQILFNVMTDDDLVVTMGAGSIGKLPQILLEA